MKREVFISADNIVSPLGFTTNATVDNILKEDSGIKDFQGIHNPMPFFASLIDDHKLSDSFKFELGNEDYTRLEKMALLSVHNALKSTEVTLSDPKTLLILSSTKGNIDLLEGKKYVGVAQDRVLLTKLAQIIQHKFSSPNQPLIVCNGCISGVLAIIIGARLIKEGKYTHVVVVGGDIVSEFTISGFQSFKALSDGPCKPFDKFRKGLNLGEGASTLILTSLPSLSPSKIRILGGAVSNDANHISGPSRTGEGLLIAINNTLQEAGEGAQCIDYVSAHGTATPYNDEMESLAFSSAGLSNAYVNSLKGYFGHTLGAAGVIESVMMVKSLERNILFGTKGFEEYGVGGKIQVVKKTFSKELNTCLKTASGFGGCNAALLFRKDG